MVKSKNMLINNLIIIRVIMPSHIPLQMYIKNLYLYINIINITTYSVAYDIIIIKYILMVTFVGLLIYSDVHTKISQAYKHIYASQFLMNAINFSSEYYRNA